MAIEVPACEVVSKTNVDHMQAGSTCQANPEAGKSFGRSAFASRQGKCFQLDFPRRIATIMKTSSGFEIRYSVDARELNESARSPHLNAWTGREHLVGSKQSFEVAIVMPA
jgi:hypothetical protein